MIIDHIALAVSEYHRSKQFYSKALAPLNVSLLMEFDNAAGFGKHEKPEFWLGARAGATRPVHIAFAAENREQVKKFHEAAIAAGGKDNGPPGLREIYHPNYYGAFVLDPDGNNVEAVCHQPE
jgi:catechol 2,3-dioxygenase-like lactoylglutathione lyase family enzyme